MNLGMGSGFAPPRNDSQVVGSNLDATTGYDAWLAAQQGQRSSWMSDWNTRLTAAQQPVYSTPQLTLANSLIGTDASFSNPDGTSTRRALNSQDIVDFMNVERNGFNSGGRDAWAAAVGNMPSGTLNQYRNTSTAQFQTGTAGDPAALQAEREKYESGFSSTLAQMNAQRDQSAIQQQAYNQQNGGGFAGGILNESYAQPFGSTITGASGFGTGLMGGAGTTAAPSTGLTPFGAPAAPQGQGMGTTQGWGGPFSNKNPWSLG